jgi:hypothetical protein
MAPAAVLAARAGSACGTRCRVRFLWSLTPGGVNEWLLSWSSTTYSNAQKHALAVEESEPLDKIEYPIRLTWEFRP